MSRAHGGRGHRYERQRKRTPRKQSEQTITVQSLRELFTKVLSTRRKMPGDAELESLARELNGWRRFFQTELNLERRRELLRMVLSTSKIAVDGLIEIAMLDESNVNFAVAAPPDVQLILSARAEQSKRAWRDIQRIREQIGAVEAAKGWKWMADVLSALLENAMKPANPTFRPGLSPEGPLPRFIEAVAPLVTGEHPTASSIATQLKRRRKDADRREPNKGHSNE